MGSKPSQPKPIDPNVVGPLQETQNTKNVNLQDQFNRPTQTNQYGTTVDYTTNPDGSIKQTTSLGQQGEDFAKGFAGLGQQYINQAGDFVNNRPDLSSSAAFDQADKFWQQREGPRQEAAQRALDNQLANKGFSQGSEGYTQAKDDLARQQGDARVGFLNSAQGQFFNQGLAGRQQQAGELNLLSPGLQYGSQTITGGQSPFMGLQIPNVDYTQLYGLQKQQENANYAAAMQQYNGMLGGFGGLAGTLLSAPMGGGASVFGAGLGALGKAFA